MESNHSSSPHSRNEVEHLIIGELQPIISLNDIEFVLERRSIANANADADSTGTSSSFSSDSSSDEFIQVDHTSSLLPMSPKQEQEEGEEENVVSISNESLLLAEYMRSSSCNSRVSDVTIESYIPDVSPTQSPPIIQAMERSQRTEEEEDFDPNRIPNSIFQKPSSPMDWSVASNESLFSIHLGNYSFNRDQIAVLGGESGEFISSDNFYESKDPKLHSENVKCKENVSEVKNIQKPQNFTKPIVLEQALGNDNHKGGMRKQSRCCYSMSACSCKWLTCPSCSCCSCKKLCWSNCCHPTTWCNCCCNCNCNCNCKCSTWWNLCNCSRCCSCGFCSTSSWTCSIKNIFSCFSFQRSKNLQSKKVSQRCRCCFSCCS